MEDTNKIEANLNFGMSTAKQRHCMIQPQIMPNLLEHSQKKELDSNHASVVIGALLGTVDGKMIDISNCFPMTITQKLDDNQGQPELIFDSEYLKKMLKFYKQVNQQETMVGAYISSTYLDKQSMTIVQYFINLFKNKTVKSPLPSPVIMLFDPELQNNKLDIKVLNIHSFFLPECPLFSEMPYKFNLTNFEKSGLDVLFYGQEHYDTMAILEDKRESFSQASIGDLVKNQKILSNRQLMLKNFRKLIENLDDCEDYVKSVVSGEQKADPEIGRALNKCLNQFTSEDMQILEQMVHTNFRDAMMSNNLSKLQTAQINMTEKINNVFTQSLNKYLQQQNQKFQTKQDTENASASVKAKGGKK